MMQSLGLDVIDRCQNHVLVGSKVRRHYLHHDYANEKREAWRLLGEIVIALECIVERGSAQKQGVNSAVASLGWSPRGERLAWREAHLSQQTVHDPT